VDPSSAEIESLKFGGIPIRVDPMIPANEVWLVNDSKYQTILIHEGQQAGQTVEEWLTKPTVYRIVNICNPFDMKPKMIEWPKTEPKFGDWPWPEK
jgi:hypothetical protein